MPWPAQDAPAGPRPPEGEPEGRRGHGSTTLSSHAHGVWSTAVRRARPVVVGLLAAVVVGADLDAAERDRQTSRGEMVRSAAKTVGLNQDLASTVELVAHAPLDRDRPVVDQSFVDHLRVQTGS